MQKRTQTIVYLILFVLFFSGSVFFLIKGIRDANEQLEPSPATTVSRTIHTKSPTTTQKVTTTTKKGSVTTKPSTTAPSTKPSTTAPTTEATAATTTKKPTTVTTKVTTTTKKPTTTAATYPTTRVDDGKHITFNNGTATITAVWDRTGYAWNNTSRAKYLQFLYENQVTDILLNVGTMSSTQMTTFIRAAHKYGMRVSWFAENADWMNSGDLTEANRYIAYQKGAPADAKFESLHLKVEWHTAGQTAENAQKFGNYVSKVATLIHSVSEKVGWDLRFWSDQYTLSNGLSLAEHIAATSDVLNVISYRDTATEILRMSQEEINAAKKYGCKLICTVLAKSSEGANLSFAEEGKVRMYAELNTVYQSLATQGLPSGSGVGISDMTTWYLLKD